jgi:hypothetical protein
VMLVEVWSITLKVVAAQPRLASEAVPGPGVDRKGFRPLRAVRTNIFQWPPVLGADRNRPQSPY